MALYRASGGKCTYAVVAADVGVTGETLRGWVRQADEQAGHSRADEAVEGRDEELARLRAEIRRLRRPRRNGNSSGRSCAGRPRPRALPLRVLIVPVVRMARPGGGPVVHSHWAIAAT